MQCTVLLYKLYMSITNADYGALEGCTFNKFDAGVCRVIVRMGKYKMDVIAASATVLHLFCTEISVFTCFFACMCLLWMWTSDIHVLAFLWQNLKFYSREIITFAVYNRVNTVELGLRLVGFDWYHQSSDIRHTQSKNLNVSCLVFQLSLPNPLKPDVKLKMKM